MGNKLTWKFNPSIVEQYFGKNNCEKGMLVSGMDAEDRKKFGWPPEKLENNTAATAGEKWEEEVLGILEARKISCRKKDKDKESNYGKWNEEETVELLKELQHNADDGNCDDVYLYQINLNVNQTFIEQYMIYLDDTKITKNEKGISYDDEAIRIVFSRCFPDLIRARWDGKKWVLSVVDCKLSKRPKIEHKLQVGLYTWILTEKIKEWQKEKGLRDCFSVNREKAYIWNKGKEEETEFDLAQVYPFLHDFMSEILKGIIDKICSAKEPEDLNKSLECFVTQKCEWCDNFSNCKKWCAENEPMVLVPYETAYAQKFLRELSKNVTSDNILQIDGFERYLNQPANADLLRQNVFWKRFLNDKASNVEMLKLAISDLDKKQSGCRQRKTASLEMPNFEKVQLVVTAQKDEATDRIYIYGIRVGVWKDCLSVTNLKKYLDESNILEESREQVKVTYTEDINTDLTAPQKGSFSDVTITITAMERDKKSFELAEDVFIIILHGILSNIDEKNEIFQQTANWRDTIQVQAYVMDNYELNNIEEMLYEVLGVRKSLTMKEKVFDLLFWLQGENLVESEIDARPDETVSFPIVVMTSVLNRLYTFPSLVANSLSGVTGYLSSGIYATKENFKEINNSYFVNKLSNVLKNECINKYWDDKDTTELDKLIEHIMHRLDVESKIITGIRYDKSAVCHDNFKKAKTYARAFRFVGRSNNGGSLLGQLEFEAKYESMLQFVKNRTIRGMDIEQAIHEGKIIEAECTVANKVPLLDKAGKIKVDSFGNYLYEYECEYKVINAKEMFDEDKFSCVFCEKNDKNIAAIRTLIDVETKVFSESSCVVKKNCEISMPKAKSLVIMRAHGTITISAKFAEAKDRNVLLNWSPAVVGKRYLIFDYSNDFNTKKNVDAIKQVDSVRNGSRLAEFLGEVEKFYSPTGERYSVDKSQIDRLATINGNKFSASQEMAMQQLYENNITLLLGPPGTGKTDFISRALLVLCEIYRQKGKQLRVLISANSHSAIENVLFAVEKKAISANSTLDIYKAERFDDGSVGQKGCVKIVNENELRKLMNQNSDKPFLVGATVWTTHKWLCKKDGKVSREIPKNDFDVIVLDEASQVRLVDAVIPFTYCNKKTRLLVVGDENQLSPIILGAYDKEIEEPFRFGSVFRYLSDYSYYYNKNNAGFRLDYKKTLAENFRMNEILVRYPEQEIYKSGYKSFNDTIATQTLNYKVRPEAYLSSIASNETEDNISETLTAMLDEAYPLVLCIVSGSSQVEILEKEIKWITRITRTLENCLGAQNQKEFWGSSTEDGKFGIIAPHHEHISRLKDALTEVSQDGFIAPWGQESREDVYVGTVDKLQGKEREAVIVSYGIGDIERAIGEGEFIYSRNRLNVSLTRGKKKTIVFLTEALLDYPIEALGIDDREILEGINFICEFKKFMNNTEDDTGVEVKKFTSNIDGTGVTVFRKKVD